MSGAAAATLEKPFLVADTGKEAGVSEEATAEKKEMPDVEPMEAALGALKEFGPAIPYQVADMLKTDHSDAENHSIYPAERHKSGEMDAISTTEYWTGGSRRVTLKESGEVEITAEEDWGKRKFTVKMMPGESASLEWRSALWDAPKRKTKFFDEASRWLNGPAHYVENTRITMDDGTPRSKSELSAEQSIYQQGRRGDVYKLTRVEQRADGKVYWGSMDHGIGIGFRPKMKESQ